MELSQRAERQGHHHHPHHHYLEEAEQLCRNIGIIDHGRIVENTSMKALLKTLHVETFLLDLKEAQLVAPQLNGYPSQLVDAQTLEVQVEKSLGHYKLFHQLLSTKSKLLKPAQQT